MLSPRWIVPLCLASLLWAFSFGLNAPVAALWLKDAGFSEDVVGLNTSTYYLGIALSAGLVPLLMRRWGYAGLVLGMIGSGLTCAGFPWSGGSLTVYFGWRCVNGLAAALSLIPIESFINQYSSPERRARNFGCYAFCIALGMALGTVIGMQGYTALPRLMFLAGGLAGVAGGVVVLAWKPRFLAESSESSSKAPLDFGRNFLSFGSAWSQGFLEGGMVGLLPIYLLSAGLSEEGVGYLMGGLMIGVILAQVPVAWLADRLGSTSVLAGCNVVSLLGIACLMQHGGHTWLALWLFAVGACSSAFYPLGLARLGERVAPQGLARATSWFLAINCLGSVIGPALAGKAMKVYGGDSLFLTGAGAVGLILGAWVLLELGRRLTRRRLSSEPTDSSQDLRPAA